MRLGGRRERAYKCYVVRILSKIDRDFLGHASPRMICNAWGNPVRDNSSVGGMSDLLKNVNITITYVRARSHRVWEFEKAERYSRAWRVTG